jgi:hypothetical protein
MVMQQIGTCRSDPSNQTRPEGSGSKPGQKKSGAAPPPGFIFENRAAPATIKIV